MAKTIQTISECRKLIKKVNEDLENLSSAIRYELDNFKADILSEAYPYPDLDDLAKSYGYRAYGSDGRDDALVMNVKGMPDLDLEELGLDYEKDYKLIQNEIELLADTLSQEFPGFIILGHMGGYWGLDKLNRNITISDKGYEALEAEVKELLQDPDLWYKEALEEAKTEDEKDGIIYDCIYENTSDLGYILNDNSDYLDIEPEFLKRMNELKEIILSQEKAMQSKEYWQDFTEE